MINKILQENFKKLSKNSTISNYWTTGGIHWTFLQQYSLRRSLKSRSLNMQFDFQMKQIGLTVYLDEVDRKNNQTSRDENSNSDLFLWQFNLLKHNLNNQLIQLIMKNYKFNICLQMIFVKIIKTKILINKAFNVDQLLTVTLQNKASNRTCIFPLMPFFQRIDHAKRD